MADYRMRMALGALSLGAALSLAACGADQNPSTAGGGNADNSSVQDAARRTPTTTSTGQFGTGSANTTGSQVGSAVGTATSVASGTGQGTPTAGAR